MIVLRGVVVAVACVAVAAAASARAHETLNEEEDHEAREERQATNSLFEAVSMRRVIMVHVVMRIVVVMVVVIMRVVMVMVVMVMVHVIIVVRHCIRSGSIPVAVTTSHGVRQNMQEHIPEEPTAGEAKQHRLRQVAREWKHKQRSHRDEDGR